MAQNKLPLLSLIMPCYNEEEVIGYTIPRLINAFESNAYPLELIACNNGSSDRTGELIQNYIDQGCPIKLKNIVFALILQICCAAASAAPVAVAGVIDLSDWNFDQSGTVELTGQYDFYWQQHLDPKAVPEEALNQINVPRSLGSR